jgi:protein O-mannosyl-transferase
LLNPDPITEQRSGSGKIPGWAIYVVLAATALVFLRALFNDFASWDDDEYILKNPHIREFSWENIRMIFSSFYLDNYHPFTTLIYLITFTLFKLDALPYHLINVILHLLNTYLLYRIVDKLSGRPFAALIVAALFALHPMHVESVAWISELKDVLYTAFYFGAMLAWLRYSENGRKKHYVISMLLFACSLMSKSAAVTLPLILILMDWYKGRRISIRTLAEKTPFLALALLFGILALVSQHGSIRGFPQDYGLLDKIFLTSYAMSFYIIKLFVPFKLSAMHYYPGAGSGFLPWHYYVSVIGPGLVALLMILKTRFRRELIFGLLFFLIAIAPMLQVIAVGHAITAERYTYVSYTGLFFIVGWLASEYGQGRWKIWMASGMAAVILIFAYLSFSRIAVWKNGHVLFTDVISKYPDNYHGYWIRGNIKKNEGDIRGALSDFTLAIERSPEFAELYLSRAGIYETLGEIPSALSDYEQAVNNKPGFAEAYINRANLMSAIGDTAAALRDYNEAIELKPERAESWFNRGKLHEASGNLQAALEDYDKAIARNPRFAQAWGNRGLIKANSGDLTGALQDFDQAISLDPTYARAFTNRGFVKAMLGDFHGAIKDLDQSIVINPADASVYYNRGIAKITMGDAAGACSDWQSAAGLGDADAARFLQEYCE